MSSRNIYLNEEQRKTAPIIYQSLRDAKRRIKRGEKSSDKIIESIRKKLENIADSKIDYIKICDANTLQEVEEINSEVRILIACFVGKARLIDNIGAKPVTKSF
jgi:pantoate--beta-alanine ligase